MTALAVDEGAAVETVLGAEQRLEELTAGEVDSVLDREGRPHLLQREYFCVLYFGVRACLAMSDFLAIFFPPRA